MLRISNIQVYDLMESVIACRNAMRLCHPEYNEKEFSDSLVRAEKLVRCKSGSGQSNFRTGIRVSFDIVYPNYISPELQRYHFLDIVTSSSKMHTIMKMDFDKCCNKYVNEVTKENMKSLISNYNSDPSYYNFMEVVSNCPQGIELFMRCSTNYEQLATIYRQRKHHKLKEDWGAFTKMIEELPLSKELITFESEMQDK